MQDYKSLCAAVTICAILAINRHTRRRAHSQTALWAAYRKAQPAKLTKRTYCTLRIKACYKHSAEGRVNGFVAAIKTANSPSSWNGY